MSKKNSTELLELLRGPKLLVEEIRSDVVKYFTSEDLRTFVGKLFENSAWKRYITNVGHTS